MNSKSFFGVASSPLKAKDARRHSTLLNVESPEKVFEDPSLEVERILKLEPKDRTTANIKFLSGYFEENRFFKQQALVNDSKTNQYLLKNMQFAQFKPGETIFEYGDTGQLFYVII